MKWLNHCVNDGYLANGCLLQRLQTTPPLAPYMGLVTLVLAIYLHGCPCFMGLETHLLHRVRLLPPQATQ